MRRTHLLPLTWVTAVLAAMIVVNEPLRGMFDGTVDFEWRGYLVFSALLAASIIGVVLTLRARRGDPSVRDFVGELITLVAIGEAIALASAWAFYLRN